MKCKLQYTLLTAWIVAASCLGDLDVKPTDIKDQTVAFTSVSDLNAGVLGVYAGLNGQSIKISSLVSDENMTPVENTSNAGGLVMRWTHDPTTPDVLPAWQSNYQVIDRANRILAVIDGIPAVAADEVRKRRMKGELLALRAYCHLELIRHYAISYEPNDGGVPVMTVSVAGKPERNTVGDVFTQIRKDLTEAKALIPASWDTITRITRLAVSAIEARTALYQKDWNTAIAAAKEVIDAVPLATAAQFPEIWSDVKKHEVIWKLKREPQDERFGSFYRNASGMIHYAPSFKLIAAFNGAHDVRFSTWITDLNPAPADTRWAVTKYAGGQPANFNMADIKLFRVSEMYLIRAEAEAMKTGGSLASANADLEDLKSLRIDNYVHTAYGTAADVLAAVEEERFRELAFEGHRYFDLRRWKKDIVRTPQDVANIGGVITLPVTRKQYFMPIPLAEVQANRNMQQHPLYLQ